MEYSREPGFHRHINCWYAVTKKTHEFVAGDRKYKGLLKKLGDSRKDYMVLKNCTQHYDFKDWVTERKFNIIELSSSLLIMALIGLFIGIFL